MRPVRRTVGGLFPMQTSALWLAIALVVGSLIYGLTKSTWLGHHLPLAPDNVLEDFAIWEVVTYTFIEGVMSSSPATSVLFAALVIWMIGSSLEQSWGRKRFLAFAIMNTIIAGVLTLLFTPILPPVAFSGGGVMSGAIWVAYGWSFGKRQTNFWGLPVTGNGFAFIGILFVVLTAALSHWALVIPEAIAIGLAFIYVKYGSPTLWFTRFRAWQLQRQLKGRSKHLRVVGKDRNVGGGSDQYLH